MIEPDFELLLNTIAKNILLDQNFETQMRFLKIDFTEWPECLAKKIMREYDVGCKLKGREFSRFMVYDQFKVNDLPISKEIDGDGEAFKYSYLKKLNSWRGREIGMKILENPEKYEDIYFQFNSKKHSSELRLFDIADEVRNVIARMDEKRLSGMATVKIKGFELLSEMIGGFNPQRLAILHARTGLGKTTIAQNFAMAAAATGFKSIFINMEMGVDDFVGRAMQAKIGATGMEWRAGNFNAEKLGIEVGKMQDHAKIVFTDGKAITIDEIESIAIIETENEKMSFIFIDYDQKIEHNMRVEEWMALKRISERLEQLAIKTNSFILMLSQSTEEERIAASQRSMQPTSAVLSFFKQKDIDGTRFFIRAQKNRFAIRDNLLELNYDPATGKITELEILGPDYDLEAKKIEKPKMKR
jgi:hypothetical protein